MFLYLLVREFKYLKSIRKCCLGRFSFCKVINNLLVRICLLDIFISKVNYSVTIGMGLTFDSIGKDDFFFSRLVNSLYLTIMTHHLINNFTVSCCFLMILRQKLQTVVFFFNLVFNLLKFFLYLNCLFWLLFHRSLLYYFLFLSKWISAVYLLSFDFRLLRGFCCFRLSLLFCCLHKLVL